MIVKVKNSMKSWSYLECEIIHSEYMPLKNAQNVGDCLILLEMHPKDKLYNNSNVKVLRLETIKNHLRTIITDRVCYILNNEGKTIDKI